MCLEFSTRTKLHSVEARTLTPLDIGTYVNHEDLRLVASNTMRCIRCPLGILTSDERANLPLWHGCLHAL